MWHLTNIQLFRYQNRHSDGETELRTKNEENKWRKFSIIFVSVLICIINHVICIAIKRTDHINAHVKCISTISYHKLQLKITDWKGLIQKLFMFPVCPREYFTNTLLFVTLFPNQFTRLEFLFFYCNYLK